MDAHLKLPRAECVAAALMARLGRPLPNPATPTDYERILRPFYGFSYGLAQVLPIRRRRNGPFERAWEVLAGEERETDPSAARAARAGFPLAIGSLNRLLRSDFEADVTPGAIFRTGRRRGHRDGGPPRGRRRPRDHRPLPPRRPAPDEAEWPLPGGGRLHNTGSWVFSSAFHHPGTPPNSYWPGTVTWLEDNDPPRRAQLLLDHSHEQMLDLINRTGS